MSTKKNPQAAALSFVGSLSTVGKASGQIAAGSSAKYSALAAGPISASPFAASGTAASGTKGKCVTTPRRVVLLTAEPLICAVIIYPGYVFLWQLVG